MAGENRKADLREADVLFVTASCLYKAGRYLEARQKFEELSQELRAKEPVVA